MSGFTDARGTPLIDKARDANTGAEPIDPAVFVDDDGQAYMYFGTRTPKVVKLDADMISTTGGIGSLSVSGNNYGEAPWLFKRDGVYYFLYSTGWPGQIVYATGSSPLGPFTYRGVVLDYVNIDTNHQSILQYQGEWYIVYHKNGLPGGGQFRRSLAMDHLYFNADGTIKQVVQTTTGVGPVGGTTPPVGGSLLRGVGANRCLDVPGGATANGTLLSIRDCAGGTNQQWTALSNWGLQVYGNKCIDVPGHATSAGTQVVIWDCNGRTNQQWTLNADGTVVGRESGLCLDVTGAGTANGAAVKIWNCNGGSNQKWTRQ